MSTSHETTSGTFPSLIACLLFSLLVVQNPEARAAELKAGTAKAVITPSLDKPHVSVRGEVLESVSHDIYARVLVLNDGAHRLVFVVNDLNCLDVATPILRQRCRDELKIDVAYLVILATHNHAAPIQIVPDNFAYGRWLADRIFALIQEAIAAEQGPVRVEFGFGYEYSVKSYGNAPADFEIQVLRVTRNDKPLAILFTQATHPLQEPEKQIGTGHPGYAVEEVEAQTPGAMALYADACGANQFSAKGAEGPIEAVKAYGKQVGETVLGICRQPLRDVTGPLDSAFKVISLLLAKPIAREAATNLARFYPTDIGFVPYPQKDRGSNWVRALLKYYNENIPFPTCTTDMVCTDDAFLVKEYDTPREFPCRFEETIVSKIGPLVFVAMQGEVCAPIGMRIKDAFRCDRPIMAVAYEGEHNLYIPTRELVRENLYPAQVIHTQYAGPVGWAPEVEDEMVVGVTSMINEALSRK